MSPMLAGHTTGRVRFRREAQAAAGVTHDHIVTIHAVDEAKGLPYLVMQYISGRSLQQRIDDCGALELKEILRIGMQAASGLAAAHAQGLVHRDIKPANILLENGIERVKITDFGLARATDDARVTQSGIVAGTPQYMSPEQASGKSVDHRADLFSLGGVLYAMCTGYAPFRASSSMAVLKKVCDETPRPIRDLNAEIPEWLVSIVDKLMAKDPKDRFQSAQEVASLLGQHLAHMQQPAVFPEPPGVTRPKAAVAKGKRGSSWVIAPLILILLLVVCPIPLAIVGAIGWLFMRPTMRPVSDSGPVVTTTVGGSGDDEPTQPKPDGNRLNGIGDAVSRTFNDMDRELLAGGLNWFPEESTFCACYSFPNAPVELSDGLWGLLKSMGGRDNPMALISSAIGDGSLDRISFAYVEDPAGKRSRNFMRITGLWNRDRAIHALTQGQRVTSRDLPLLGEGRVKLIVLDNELAVAVVSSRDILLGAYDKIPEGSKGHEEVIQEALECKASSKRSLRNGPLAANIAQIPGNAFCLLAGDFPKSQNEPIKNALGVLPINFTISAVEGKGDGAANTMNLQEGKDWIALSFSSSMQRRADAEALAKNSQDWPKQILDFLEATWQWRKAGPEPLPNAPALAGRLEEARKVPPMKVEAQSDGLYFHGTAQVPPSVWRAGLALAKATPLFQPSPSTVPVQRLKQFDPKTDKPVQTDFGGKHVTVENATLRIDSTADRHDAGPKFDLKLIELPKQNLQNSTVILRFKMKAEKPVFACIVPMLGEPASWYAGIGSQLARMADSYSATTDWRTCEVKRNYTGAEPADITIVADIDGPGTIWIKDLEIIKMPLPPAPPASSEPKQNLINETVLKKFDSKTDKPFQTELADRQVTIEGDSWRIDAKKAPLSGPGFTIFAPDIRLFELPKQNVQQSTVMLRFKMKSEKLTVNACVGLSIRGQPIWRWGPEFDTSVIGTTDWKNYAVPNWCKDSEPADIAILANIGGTGTIWLKDIQLVKIPLPTPASPPPTTVGTPPSKETVLKKFDPKTDKPITNSAEGRKVSEQDGGWQVELQGPPFLGEIDKAPRTELFELRQPVVAGCRVTLRAQLKTELTAAIGTNVSGFALELDVGPIGAAAKIGPVRRDETNWSNYEVSIDWLRLTNPETLKINARLAAGKGKVLINELQIVTTPLLDLPAPKKNGANESILFRFTPDQKPITTELLFKTIKPEKDGWQIADGSSGGSVEHGGPHLRLFELAKPEVAGRRVTVRCKIRSEKVSWAHLYLRGDQDDPWLTLGRKIEGTTNWTDYEFSYEPGLRGQLDRLGVDASLDRGAIWLKDLEIVKTPSAEFLELQRLQGSWQAVQGEEDGKPLTEEQVKGWRVTVTDRSFALDKGPNSYKGEISSLTVDREPHPATVQLMKGGPALFLLYDLEGDTWKVCGRPPGTYTQVFDSKAGWLVTFKRIPTGKPRAENEIVLKKFDPKIDKPVTQQVNYRKVTTEANEWRIELQGVSELGNLDQVSRIHLFEAPGPPNEQSRITLRFKVKTEDVNDARLDVHVRRAALDDVVVKGRVIEGTTNWTTHEISWDGNMTSKPASVAIDLLMRAKDGTTKAIVLLKDVELVKTPLPK
jgi:uncharacterized protein (TIGR03067 family)